MRVFRLRRELTGRNCVRGCGHLVCRGCTGGHWEYRVNPETMLCQFCTWHIQDGHEPKWFDGLDDGLEPEIKGWWCHGE